MNRLTRTLMILVVILIAGLCASPALACFGVIVGKKASVDGAVLLAHNEQDGGPYFLNFRKVPRRQFAEGETVRLFGGGRVPQVRETNAFLWSECPGLHYSDSYLNEYGVAICSNGCRDREGDAKDLEKRGQLVKGGISYMLRHLVIERAKTSREGVEIAGELIGRFGYRGARTLTIADPNEAWMLSMANGKHWVAQRVPDDRVVLMPNYFIVGEVDLDDKENFIASPGLVEYAVERGWYDPDSGQPFRFNEVYGPARKPLMDVRQWRGQSLVGGEEISRSPDRALPFSVKPGRKFSVKDAIEVLRFHGPEGSLCKKVTVEAAVFQLRSGMPPDIGCVYWRTSGEACTSVLTPWYAGVTKVPAAYCQPIDLERHLTLESHFDESPEKYKPNPEHYWWVFRMLQDRVNEDRADRFPSVRAAWDRFEKKLFAKQPKIEKEALALYKKGKDAARKRLTVYSRYAATEAVGKARLMYRQVFGPYMEDKQTPSRPNVIRR